MNKIIECPACGNTSLATMSLTEAFVRFSPLIGVGLTKDNGPEGVETRMTLALEFNHEHEESTGTEELHCHACDHHFAVPDVIEHVLTTDNWEWNRMLKEGQS